MVPKSHTMLLGFQAKNVRSFRGNIDFSLEATAMAEPKVVREVPWRENGRNYMKVLPVASISGRMLPARATCCEPWRTCGRSSESRSHLTIDAGH